MITLIPWSSALKTQADHYGELVAVSDGERELTAALASRAARLAEMLLAATDRDRPLSGGSAVEPLRQNASFDSPPKSGGSG